MAAPMNQVLGGQPSAGGGGPGPQMGPIGSQQQQLGMQQQQQDFDPVQRYRMLIPQLKESLQNLMKIAALNLAQNTNIDNGQKIADVPVQRFDKSLEEFYALCDQMELCLAYYTRHCSRRLIMEIVRYLERKFTIPEFIILRLYCSRTQ
ncbi:mediator of RNA polymerase II transcription subunit 29 isoform X2 [Hyperolius riggenbachi]|uniref:mediator of RNA polymerase II transcription subunit 29 isoform X2 n=1 Tax=Hyperolius riggenbachi TaxID=752182 RepID=UPI0035A3A0F9